MTDIIDVPFISLRIKIFLTPIFQNWTHLKVFFFDDGYQRFFIYFITHKNISNTLSENVFFKGTNQTLIFVFFKITHLFFKVGRKTIKLIFQLEKNSASNSFCIHQKVTFFCKKNQPCWSTPTALFTSFPQITICLPDLERLFVMVKPSFFKMVDKNPIVAHYSNFIKFFPVIKTIVFIFSKKSVMAIFVFGNTYSRITCEYLPKEQKFFPFRKTTVFYYFQKKNL